jgi:hypothetical protein
VQVGGETVEVDAVVFDTVGTRVYATRTLAAPSGAPTATDAHGHRLSRDPHASATERLADRERAASAHRAHAAAAIDGMSDSCERLLICEVRAREDGTNVLLVRSPLRLRNATEIDLEVRLHGDAATSSAPNGRRNGRRLSAATLSVTVAAGETWAVPLHAYQHARGGVSVRPLAPDGEPSEHAWSRVISLSELAARAVFQCAPASASGSPQRSSTEGRRVSTSGSGAPLSSFFCLAEAEADGGWDDTAAHAAPVDVPLGRELFGAGRPVTIALHVPFVLHNLLAVDTNFSIRSRGVDGRRGGARSSNRIERGGRCALHCLDPTRAVQLSFEVDGFTASNTVSRSHATAAYHHPGHLTPRAPSHHSIPPPRHLTPRAPSHHSIPPPRHLTPRAPSHHSIPPPGHLTLF